MQDVLGIGVPFVVVERPRAVQRRGTQVVLVPGNHVAGGVADAAVDAFDGRVGQLALLALRQHLCRRIVARGRADKGISGACPLLKELPHVDDQVLDPRHVAQGLDDDHAGFLDAAHMRAARPARRAVDGHRTGSAHANAAGVAVREAGLLRSLDFRHHIQDGLVVTPRDQVGGELAVLRASRNANRQLLWVRGVLRIHFLSSSGMLRP